MTIGQFGGDLHHTLGSPGPGVFENQRPPPPDGMTHFVIVDDIAQIVEVDAKIFQTGAPNRKTNLNIFL
jgi:hypothetical protein